MKPRATPADTPVEGSSAPFRASRGQGPKAVLLVILAGLSRLSGLAGLAGLAGLLLGCLSPLIQDPPPQNFYVLEAALPARSQAGPRDGPVPPIPPVPSVLPVLDGTLLVRDIRVAPPYNTRNLTYRTGPAAFESDYYHLFLTQPGEMITQQTRQWLARTGLFSHVALPGSGMARDYVLEGLVTELYGDFTREPGQAVMAAQFFLLDERGVRRAVIFGREYRQKAALTDFSQQGLVEALDRAFTSILRGLTKDMENLAAGRDSDLPSP